jgi:hypothetical protein
MVNLINLTPHPLTLMRRDGEMIVPPSGRVARWVDSEEPRGELCGVPVVRRGDGAMLGLPPPEPGSVYLVSWLTLLHCQGRDDVYAPDTGYTAQRGASGRIIGARRLLAAPSA